MPLVLPEVLERATTTSLVLSAVGAAAALWLTSTTLCSHRPKSQGRFPPGPRGRLLMGNLFDMPKEKEWLAYAKMAEKYGNILGFQVLGTKIVVLNTEDDTKALFVTRNANYSHRARTPMMILCGWGRSTALVPPGDDFRTYRKLMAKVLAPQVVKKTFTAVEEISRDCISQLVNEGGDAHERIKFLSAKLIMRLAYGYEVTGHDQFVQYAEDAIQSFIVAIRPDWMVNSIPFLRHLPTWFPGAGFHAKAAEIRAIWHRSHDLPHEWVKAQLAAGTAKPSFAVDLMTDPTLKCEDDQISNVLGDLYTAGSDTLIAACLWVLVALTLFPHVQRRLQEEIETVIGEERLPTLEDRPQLPYLDAFLKEVFRWNVVTNIGLPHVAMADDEYKGFAFKKGTIFFANVWSILHHPDKYPEPLEFKPERFLGPNVEGVNEDPQRYAFGFGLRICPGRHLADAAVWMFAAQLTATCNVSDPVYVTGKPLTLETLDSTNGIVHLPLPFTVKAVPRSSAAAALLHD